MRRAAVICVLVAVLLLTGCTVGGGFSDTDSELGRSGTPTPAPDCITLDKGDPNTPKCLITERPADLRVENHDSVDHNVTLHVIRNESTDVFTERARINDTETDSATVSVLNDNSTVVRTQGEKRGVLFEDVFDSPGNYTITATVENSTTDSATWNVSKRYFGTGDVEWVIEIYNSNDVNTYRLPRM